MDEPALIALVDGVADGTIHPDEAVERLRRLPFADLGDALVDHHRHLRTGQPEAIYAPGKTPDACVRIVDELLRHGDGPVILSRADDVQRAAVLDAHLDPPPEHAGSTIVWRLPEPQRRSKVLVVGAGTSDQPVVDEAALTLRATGFAPTTLLDVGVAGLHRLLAHLDTIRSADALIVVAGMEGALASVITGLTAVPVVAVPTSTGYGSALDGVTALLAMHSSCATGATVVGIDNGFGAACAIARMLS